MKYYQSVVVSPQLNKSLLDIKEEKRDKESKPSIERERYKRVGEDPYPAVQHSDSSSWLHNFFAPLTSESDSFGPFFLVLLLWIYFLIFMFHKFSIHKTNIIVSLVMLRIQSLM